MSVAPASPDGPNRKVRKEEARLQRERLQRKMARRRFYRWGVAGAVVVAALVVGTVLVLNKGSSSPRSTPTPGVLADLQKGSAPWSQGVPGLKERLQAMGLPYGAQEQLAYHIHMHLEVFVDGKAETVPAGVGINNVGPSCQQFITVLHTHDTSGIIHVESPVQRAYTLGQFFDVWGVYLTKDCLGDKCAAGDQTLRAYVNGKEWTGDPTQIPLNDELVIVLAFGSADQVPNPVPASFVPPA